MEEMRRKMEERVHLIRQQMEEAAGQAGRAPEEITLLAASKTQSAEIVALSAALPIVDIKSKRYDNVHMDCLSMGMTHDYADAILEGATLVRIGTGIYGPRIYKEETP